MVEGYIIGIMVILAFVTMVTALVTNPPTPPLVKAEIKAFCPLHKEVIPLEVVEKNGGFAVYRCRQYFDDSSVGCDEACITDPFIRKECAKIFQGKKAAFDTHIKVMG